ncbi:MAG: hypothetical protein ABSG42_03015 [Nitrospirota bacterium]
MKKFALAAVVFLLVDAALVYAVQVRIDHNRSASLHVLELGALPRGDYLKKISMGYDGLIADLLWLKTVQVMAIKKPPPGYSRWIFHAIDVATDLDPKFDYIYEAGGIFLSAVTKDYVLSNEILKKGFYNNPREWQLPFYIGFNYFFHLNDFKQAAYYMARAAELPGRPQFVPLLATRLYAESGNPRFALELLQKIYESTDDDRVKEVLEQRMKELVVEINLDELDRLVSEYHKEYGKYPTLEDLLAKGFIRSMPRDPMNGRYSINPLTGEVTSSVLKRRLRVYKPED